MRAYICLNFARAYVVYSILLQSAEAFDTVCDCIYTTRNEITISYIVNDGPKNAFRAVFFYSGFRTVLIFFF